jgi:hypothetical protein
MLQMIIKNLMENLISLVYQNRTPFITILIKTQIIQYKIVVLKVNLKVERCIELLSKIIQIKKKIFLIKTYATIKQIKMQIQKI